MPLHHPPKARPHSPHEDRLPQQRPALLRPPEDERHLDALLRPAAQRGVRQPARHGGGPVRVLVGRPRFLLFR